MLRPSACAVIGAAALAVLPAAPAAAAPPSGTPARTSTYSLPGSDVFPEGVTVQGRDFYVGSTTDGTIYRGRLGDPTTEVFLAGGQDGRTTAVGLASTSRLLLVAGGGTGQVLVHDRRSGEFLGAFGNGLGEGETFVNDLRVSPRGDVYVTDSARDLVYVVPAAELAAADPDDVGELQVLSAASEGDPQGSFTANGIAVAGGGRYLLVVQSDTGALFRIATRTGELEPVELSGGGLAAGDGIELRGRTLYVVERAGGVGRVVEIRLSGDLSSGRVVDAVTDGSFDDPTTVALAGDRLLVVNSRFGARGGDPSEPFTVSSVRRR